MYYSTNHPQFQDTVQLYRYWCDLPGRKLRRDIDPLAIGGRLLSHVSLGSSLDGGNDVRYDLIGSVLAASAPRLKPGSRTSDTAKFLPTIDEVQVIMSEAVRQQQMKLIESHYFSLEGILRQTVWILLPLGIDPDKPCCEDLLMGNWVLVGANPEATEKFYDLSEWFLNTIEHYQP